jgi:hypothetical protein
VEVQEVLQRLKDGARVLDLGCGEGSYASAAEDLSTIRVDLDKKSLPNFVQADAARLPFRAATFDAVVSNHSLEHIQDLDDALREIGRVIKRDGLLYVAVPDASTFSDRLYRWLGRGGGHVNPFTSAGELAAQIERATGLTHGGTRTLLTSLAFLNRANLKGRMQRKMFLIGGGTSSSLMIGTYIMRRLDGWLGTRLSVYGWAFVFGSGAQIDGEIRTNVCIRCGSGHASDWLRREGRVRKRIGFQFYTCPGCGAANLLTEDERSR